MTKGLMLGIGRNIPANGKNVGHFYTAQRPRFIAGSALSLAVSVAILTSARAVETNTYPEPQIVPVETADYYATPEMPEPPSPGEGPDSNDIDVITVGEQGSAQDFWKPEIHFGATVGAIFQDNVFITNENQVSDVVLVASARVTVAFGNVESWASRFIDTSSRALAAEEDEDTDNLVAITYAPTANFFVDNDRLNTVDEDVAATLRWTFSKLTVAVDGRFRTLSDPDEDLGRRSDRTIITGNVRASYEWSEKTSLEISARISNRSYDDGSDSLQLDGSLFVLYRVQPKTTIGFGLGGGELKLYDGESQTFQQVLARVRYDTFSKVSFSATVGGELRQNEAGSDQTNGVFQIGVTYRPANDTQIFLSAYERVEPSATGNSASIERISFALGLNQRIFQKLTFSGNVDYSLADYTARAASANSDREDKLFSISATLTFEVTDNGFVRLGYLYRQDDSSLIRNNYEANQVIVSFTALF